MGQNTSACSTCKCMLSQGGSGSGGVRGQGEWLLSTVEADPKDGQKEPPGVYVVHSYTVGGLLLKRNLDGTSQHLAGGGGKCRTLITGYSNNSTHR